MNTFYLIRHGQKVTEAGDPGLTELGGQQSRKTAEFLKDKNILKIYSSTFARAWETTEIINEILKVGVIFDDRLREKMNWGSIPNQTLKEFLKEWEYSNLHRDFKPKAGISSLQSGQDVFNVISEISVSLPDSNIVIVTHGGVICDLLRNLFSDDELREFKQDFPELLDKLIKECSITTLVYENNKFKLGEISSTKHLSLIN
ncbi:MAG: histidine phosphatase family protein [Candidatus Woesebacteria bacterium]|nr:histidine phosphatase family protein [Candidatus Woesebacteria bacterium]